jgi:hypothetical protein
MIPRYCFPDIALNKGSNAKAPPGGGLPRHIQLGEQLRSKSVHNVGPRNILLSGTAGLELPIVARVSASLLRTDNFST